MEPVRIPIETGLTGVVGPNGCGKSNLFEALRWVMGATSAKALRGEGMADVIFAGSSARPARNWAEVAVVVEPTAGTAPPPFDKSDRLEIARRVDRDGGSTYRLNGKEVRARDIQVLFADSSTGANSPALVRQGQVAELIAAKPKNRRMILEDAAGVAGLHTRRREAEQRLRAAEDNLARLGDVIAQIETQHRSLEKQARDAERYRTLSAEIRDLEAETALARWTGAAREAAEAHGAVEAAHRQVADHESAAARAATEATEAASALAPAREEHAVAAALFQRIEIEVENLAREAARADEAARTAARRAEEARTDLESEIARKREADERAQTCVERRDALLDASKGHETDAQEAKQRAEETDARRLRAEAALEDAARAVADAEAERRNREARLEDARDRLAELEHDADARRRERDDLTADLRAAENRDSATQRVDDARAGAEDAERTAEEARRATQEAEAAAADAENALEPLATAARESRDRLSGLRMEADGLRRLLDARSDQDAGAPVADSITAQAGYEKALGAALERDLNASLHEDAGRRWTDAASREAAAPLPDGVRPLHDFVSAPAELAARLDRTGVVEPQDGARLQSLLRPGQRLVSRSGDLWRWDGLRVRGDAPAAAEAVMRLERRNRLAALEPEEHEAAESAERAAANLAAGRVALEQARASLKTRRDAERTTSERVKECGRRLERAQADLSEAQTAHARHEARLAACEDALAERDAAVEDARETLAVLEADTSGATAGDDLAAVLTDARQAAEKARADAADAQAAWTAIVRDEERRAASLQEAEADLAFWTERRDAADALIDEKRRRSEAAAADLQTSAGAPARLAEARHALADKRMTAEARRDRASDALAVAETHARTAEDALRRAEREASASREARAKAQGAFETARARFGDVTAHASEVLRVDAAGIEAMAAKFDPANTPDPNALEGQLRRVRAKRDAMGAVNLRADEEAAEFQARLDGLFADRTDLETAITKLRQGVADLNREGRERLVAAFEEVRGHFAALFERLFEGGEAHLELVEAEDPLEAGLEIRARPPGKRMGPLSLMSGGEQALTATALVFAVFLSRPAPICVLDEVDAPLDDTNVDRFCRLMDQMARETETRFLCITHHPLTMSRMDRLFGVTMAERGVSQLVSVDLARAETLIAAQ